MTLRENERIDDLERDGLVIIQDNEHLSFGMDAVLLTSFAQIKPNARVIDLGTGTGIIPILLTAKTKAREFEALEIQPESADMARRSVEVNHLSDRIHITTGDIKDASKIFGASSFDTVTTNPPYMIAEHGKSSPNEALAIARHEIRITLEELLRESYRLLKTRGTFFMVHRPFRLAEIFSQMVSCRIEPKRMRLVYPFEDKEPNMVLIEGVKDGRSRLTVEPPLIVYESPGNYTEELKRMYYG